MDGVLFSIIIATHNRAGLVARAIDSAFSQKWEGLQVIVVDDGSTDGTESMIRVTYPGVEYVRLDGNYGPGVARNHGISRASGTWALILDDDDMLAPHALQTIADNIASAPGIADYPVINFATSNGRIPEPHMVLSCLDYMQGRVVGDFLPVLQVRLFRDLGLVYPDSRVGGEHLLWWEVAERFGIPAWNVRVSEVSNDAPRRLTSVSSQLALAKEHALLQDQTLLLFKDLMATHSPAQLTQRLLGSATYWLLAGERKAARARLKETMHRGRVVFPLALYVVSLLPLGAVKYLFALYRTAMGQRL